MKPILSCLVLLLAAVSASAFTPLSLEKVANASRMDEQAADGKGGWLDLGSNDLRVLPSGRHTYASVPFDVPPCADANTPVCLVLGRHGAEEKVTLATDGVKGERLYLLHAMANCTAPEIGDVIGRLKLTYEDGTSVKRKVKSGRTVGDWTDARSCREAVRAWTAYNGHTQVSLYVASFELDPNRTLSSVQFKATGTHPWMVLATTVGKRTRAAEVRPDLNLKQTFRSPPARTKRLVRSPAGQRPKNVILIIGDGMGQGAIRFASLYQHCRENALQMQQMPVAGFCTTQSASHDITDSSAAVTAFATGTKTSNGVLGLGIDSDAERAHPRPLVSIAEKAHADGRAVALITNDRITGATPAGFYAHVTDRGDAKLIAEQAAACGFDVMIGVTDSLSLFRSRANGGRRSDRDLCDEMASRGYVFVTSQLEFDAAPKSAKVLGGLLCESQPEDSLSVALKAALARISDTPKGFFMMCESSAPDHGNHANDPARTMLGTLHIDWAAAAALDFAEARGDTLVIVTADHETGGVSAIRSPDGDKTYIHYSSVRHTTLPVALYAYGPGAERFEGLMDNTDIAKRLFALLGL